MLKNVAQLIFSITILFSISSRSEDAPLVDLNDKGIGPVTTLKLEPLNEKLAATGKEVFTKKCSACHKIEEKYVGPALKGVSIRRSPEWIMNMILNPAKMIEENEIAKDLYATLLTPMPDLKIPQDEARAILDFFRQNDAKK